MEYMEGRIKGAERVWGKGALKRDGSFRIRGEKIVENALPNWEWESPGKN